MRHPATPLPSAAFLFAKFVANKRPIWYRPFLGASIAPARAHTEQNASITRRHFLGSAAHFSYRYMTATATSAKKVSLPPSAEVARHDLQNKLGIDLSLRMEQLKAAMLDFEESGPGNNLVGSKVSEFARHCQMIVWKDLARLRASKPAEYEAWRSGEHGYWPMETNNVALATLLRLDEGRRAKLHQPDAAAPRTKGGMLVVSDNLRRTALNWRRKLTAEWEYNNGDVRKGFPFFMSWVRLNRSGQPDPKGRGNVVGYVNLRWIFGPEWSPIADENDFLQNAENQPGAASHRENFSTIPLQVKTAPKGDKKEDEAVSYGHFQQSAKPTEPERNRHQAGTPADSVPASGEKNIPAAGGGAAARAVQIWAVLLRLIYAPLFGTGRIRFSAERDFYPMQFQPSVENTALKMLEINILAVRDAGEISLEEAQRRLIAAIERQAQALNENPAVWVKTPTKFLDTRAAHGTLLSAVRAWVQDSPPPKPAETADLTEPEAQKHRRSLLYRRLLGYGAHRTHPGTLDKWCREHGMEHVEACLNFMGQEMARRRQAGKAEGSEFDTRKGGAAAYFAGLVKRFDSRCINDEAELARRKALKIRLWGEVANLSQNHLSEQQQATKARLMEFYHSLTADADRLSVVISKAQSHFAMPNLNLRGFDDLILLEWVALNVKD